MRRWKRLADERRNSGGLLAAFCVVSTGLFGALVLSMAGGQALRALALPVVGFSLIAFLPLAMFWSRPRRDLLHSQPDTVWSRLCEWVRGRQEPHALRPWKRKRQPPPGFGSVAIFSPAREIGSDIA